MIYDLVIIGAGPAGITASVYAARKRMNFMVISKDIGGQTAWSGDIENYTGYQFISGPELTTKFEKHMRRYNVELKETEEVRTLKKLDKVIEIETNKAIYKTRTAIVASGKRSRELNVEGEKEFRGRGLTYCATCDGPLFTDKDVAVIGGGNSALDAAIQLQKIAKHVYIINISEELTGDPVMADQVMNNSNTTIIGNANVTAILGDKLVSGIRVKVDDKEKVIDLQGVFVEIGLEPNSMFAGEIDKDEQGQIKVNCDNETNVPGIFAAGDVTDVLEKQIVIAAGEGAKAALSAFRYIIKNPSYRETY